MRYRWLAVRAAFGLDEEASMVLQWCNCAGGSMSVQSVVALLGAAPARCARLSGEARFARRHGARVARFGEARVSRLAWSWF